MSVHCVRLGINDREFGRESGKREDTRAQGGVRIFQEPDRVFSGKVKRLKFWRVKNQGPQPLIVGKCYIHERSFVAHV